MDYKTTISKILENETYNQILKDSFGGIMYMEGTQTSYDSTELLKLWNTLNQSEKDSCGGITKGLFNFLNS